jgi:hypothetical protein
MLKKFDGVAEKNSKPREQSRTYRVRRSANEACQL